METGICFWLKTPYGSNLVGKYANEDLLLSFYGQEKDNNLINSRATKSDSDNELRFERVDGIEIEEETD
ncbi:hypothetical protein [Lacinutrix sp.]|uniref:hypothetical protein n=1 Tax=Lacinutrix sp. TaxID=1937692 RepID=UPI0025BC657D|nr:hypothetical protein [Lacinutrix sp.]